MRGLGLALAGVILAVALAGPAAARAKRDFPIGFTPADAGDRLRMPLANLPPPAVPAG